MSLVLGAVLKGIACTTTEAVENAAKEIGSQVVVVKAQIHAGGRGKGTVFADERMTAKVMEGGVKVVKSPQAAKEAAAKLLGNFLKTIQTGDGCKRINTVYVEEGCAIAKELYLSILMDRGASAPMLIVSREGGMDIEEVAAKTPEKILKAHFDPHGGLGAYQARRFGYEMGLSPAQVASFITTAQALAKCFLETDADLLEVNPLVITADDRCIALDSKMSFDDNALYRHPEIAAMLDVTEEDPAELEAKRQDMAFVKTRRQHRVHGNGAGWRMGP